MLRLPRGYSHPRFHYMLSSSRGRTLKHCADIRGQHAHFVDHPACSFSTHTLFVLLIVVQAVPWLVRRPSWFIRTMRCNIPLRWRDVLFYAHLLTPGRLFTTLVWFTSYSRLPQPLSCAHLTAGSATHISPTAPFALACLRNDLRAAHSARFSAADPPLAPHTPTNNLTLRRLGGLPACAKHLPLHGRSVVDIWARGHIRRAPGELHCRLHSCLPCGTRGLQHLHHPPPPPQADAHTPVCLF